LSARDIRIVLSAGHRRVAVLGLIAFTLLVFWKTPAWLVVILTALGGWALQSIV